jgi:predicted DNA-binding transcriptional regulator AlpA
MMTRDLHCGWTVINSQSMQTACKKGAQNMSKRVVSVSEMAELAGLSRQGLYNLIANNILPAPVTISGQPAFLPYQQQQILSCRNNNTDMHGNPYIFRRLKRTIAKPTNHHNDNRRLKDFQKSLGKLNIKITLNELNQVFHDCFPSGTDGINEEDVFMTIYKKLIS